MAPGAEMEGLLTVAAGISAPQNQAPRTRTGRRTTGTASEGESRPPSCGIVEPPKREALKMQTFALGATGTFEESKAAPVTAKGERVSPCGQFLIDNDGNWKPNPSNMPSRKGARDPADPVVSNRAPVKFGRRATPTGGKKAPMRPPSDSSYDTVL